MDATGFIARKLRFKGKIAMTAIAISFFIMILAVAISAGFRREIRNGASSFCGDIQLTPSDQNYISEDNPITSDLSYYDRIAGLKGVESINRAIYRAGIIKAENDIHGVLFKGIEGSGLESMEVRIPKKLAEMLSLDIGDRMLTYFVGEKVKLRKFTIKEIYDSLLEADQTLTVFLPLSDMQRLNGWEEDQVSVLEVMLTDKFKSPVKMSMKTDEIGTIALTEANNGDDAVVCSSVMQKFPQLFDWLNLIDLNVVLILILMTIVAGFNMISGLLILLFQNISTIGTLKSMGMTDKSISEVFLKVSSVLVLKGIAIGNAAGILFCLIQDSAHLIKLNPANYFVSFVPVSINIPMILLSDAVAYVVIMLLLLLPTLFIAKVDPAQTVRAQ